MDLLNKSNLYDLQTKYSQMREGLGNLWDVLNACNNALKETNYSLLWGFDSGGKLTPKDNKSIALRGTSDTPQTIDLNAFGDINVNQGGDVLVADGGGIRITSGGLIELRSGSTLQLDYTIDDNTPDTMAVSKGWVDAQIANIPSPTGLWQITNNVLSPISDTITHIDAKNANLSNVANPVAQQDAVTLSHLLANTINYHTGEGGYWSLFKDEAEKRLRDLADAVNDTDAVPFKQMKDYVASHGGSLWELNYNNKLTPKDGKSVALAGTSKTPQTIELNAFSDVNLNSGADLNVNNGADINVNNGGDINIQIDGGITVWAGGTLQLDYTIDDNTPDSMGVNKGWVDTQLANLGSLWELINDKLTPKNGKSIRLIGTKDTPQTIDLNLYSDIYVNNGGDIIVGSGGKIRLTSGSTLQLDYTINDDTPDNIGVNKGWVDAQIANIPFTGLWQITNNVLSPISDTITQIDAKTARIINVGNPVSDQDATPLKHMRDAIHTATQNLLAFDTTNDQYDATSKRIANVANPTNAQDVATKTYVDTHGGGGSGLWEEDGTSITPVENKSINLQGTGIGAKQTIQLNEHSEIFVWDGADINITNGGDLNILRSANVNVRDGGQINCGEGSILRLDYSIDNTTPDYIGANVGHLRDVAHVKVANAIENYLFTELRASPPQGGDSVVIPVTGGTRTVTWRGNLSGLEMICDFQASTFDQNILAPERDEIFLRAIFRHVDPEVSDIFDNKRVNVYAQIHSVSGVTNNFNFYTPLVKEFKGIEIEGEKYYYVDVYPIAIVPYNFFKLTQGMTVASLRASGQYQPFHLFVTVQLVFDSTPLI